MRNWIVLLVLALVIPCALLAQATTQVSGVVTDPTGAVVPSATIDLVNVETGLKRTVNSEANGAYAFFQVVPGTYRMSAGAAGFRTTTIHDVRLLVNNPATLNMKLEVGQVTETIAVTAEALLVNTTDASIGNAIGTKPIVQMPLNARNIVSLLALQPGVTYTGEDTTDYRNGAVNGGKSDQANVTLDGVDVNDQMDRYSFTSVLRMTPDSVQEFRVTTLNANADQGRSSGAQVALVTKSGTNDPHGGVYWYHRNTATTANLFFNNASNVPRQKLIRNIFGAKAGGPIVKNRLFIFGNYEGRRDAKDSSVVRTIPSMDMRQGILHYVRRDGTTATVTPQDIVRLVDARGPNQAVLKLLQSYPEPNDYTVGDGLNQVGFRFKAPTPLRWNTYIARLDYILDQENKHTLFWRGNLQNDHTNTLPQFPGQQPNRVSLTNNKGFATGLTSLLRPNFISKLTYGFTRQGWEDTGITNNPTVSLRGLSDSVGITYGFAAIIPVHTIAEDLTWTKGAHNVQFGAVVRLVSNRRNTTQASWSYASANASWLVGSGSELNTPFTDLATSQVNLFRYSMADVLGLVTQGNAQYNYKVDGSVLPEGAPVFRNFRNREYEFYGQDTWRVNRALTVIAGLRWSLMPPYYEANGQQVSPNVRIGDWFDLRGGLAQQGRSQAEAPQISFVDANGPGGTPLYDYHKKNFAPRLSMAYSPQGDSGLSRFLFGGPGKSSIRAGFGMYYDLFGSGLMRSFDATAFGLSTLLTNPSATLSLATAPRFTGITQIPAAILQPAPPAGFPKAYPNLFSIGRGIDNTVKPPYNMNANFSIGREFSGGWFAQVSYTGRYSRRSLVRRDAAMPTDLKDPKSGMNYFTAATILARQAVAGVATADVQKVAYWENLYSKAATPALSATQVVYNRFRANMWDWTYALYQLDTGAGYGNCAANNRCSDLGPYAFFNPQFSYMSVFSSIAGGNYHGGQLNVKKRFTGGDTVEVNYTFSKSQDLRSWGERAGYSTGVIWNPWNPGLMKGVSDYDNTHLFNVIGLYTLPVGKGRRFASDVHPVLNAVIGGWELAGLWRWSSGFPVSMASNGVWPTNWNNNNWAVWDGKTPVVTAHNMNATGVTNGGPNLFADPKAALAAFGPEWPGGIGTRNVVRGDGVFNIDLNVAKRFRLPWEGHSLQFRWETFNLTNTARFDVYTVATDISTPATFGKYSDQMGSARVMQFGLRYEF